MTLKTQKNNCLFCKDSNTNIITSGKDYQYKTTNYVFNWKRCKKCSHFFIDPIPSVDSLNIIYPDNIKNYQNSTRKSIAFRIKEILEAFSYKKYINKLNITKTNLNFLDIGCADGALLEMIKNNFSIFKSIEGLDISTDAVRHAVRKGFQVHVGNIHTIKLKKNYYDLIIMQQVIEHLHYPSKALQNIRKALTRDGLLIIETPNPKCIDRVIFNKFWEGYHIPRHFNLWSCENMSKMLNNNGFLLVEHKKVIKPVHWTLSIQNYMIDHNWPNILIKQFDTNNKFPIFLVFFSLIDLLLLIINSSSSSRYVVKKSGE